jgi:hypothetical protein
MADSVLPGNPESDWTEQELRENEARSRGIRRCPTAHEEASNPPSHSIPPVRSPEVEEAGEAK